MDDDQFTYDRRIGMVNTDERDPQVTIGGVMWCTRDSIPVMVPDQWYEQDEQKKMVGATTYDTLPVGTEVIRLPSGDKVTL